MQWGRKTGGSDYGIVQITYPIAFSTWNGLWVNCINIPEDDFTSIANAVRRACTRGAIYTSTKTYFKTQDVGNIHYLSIGF